MVPPDQLDLKLTPGQLSLARVDEVAKPAQVGSRSVPLEKPAAREAAVGRARPKLSVIPGDGKPEPRPLRTRNDLAGVLVGAASDLLLRRISSVRAHEIEKRVDRLMDLFDRVDSEPLMMKVLRRELDDLEALLKESPHHRPKRSR
jgi:hypothetical protein